MIEVFGLKNCSTCVKAQKMLMTQGLSFQFQDVRQTPPTAEQLKSWSAQVGWDSLINKKSQTWRGLSDEQKSLTQESDLIALVQEQPSLMKRPLLVQGDTLILGFDEKAYQQLA
ncbi:MAG: Spx/MgsR family RNA polymerase-binding regulatory protein [Pelistega sp.]|nr:Spx/MgsR family RNA polymerase-binding regulatory protein [Pelistega sp.]